MAEVKWDEPKAGPAVQWDEPAAAPAEAGSTRLFRRYLAEPATALIGGALQADPRLQGAQGALSWLTHGLISPPEPPSLGRTVSRVVAPFRGTDLPADKPLAGEGVSQTIAEGVVPQTPTQLATMAATGGAGKLATGIPAALTAYPKSAAALQALSRVTGGLIGNEAGNLLEEKPAGTGALATGGVLGAMEAAVPAFGAVRRMMPGAKARINEMQASHLADVLGAVSPDLAAVLPKATARVAPGTAGKTAAGIQELALGELGQEALSGRSERMVQQIEQALPNFSVNSRALQQAYRMMPPLIRDQVGPIAPNGFTVRQAQKVKGWIGSQAFAESPLGQGVDPASKQILEGQVAGDIQSALLNQGWDARRGVQATAAGMGRAPLALPQSTGQGVGPPGRFEQGPMPEAASIRQPPAEGLVPMRSGPQDTLAEAAALVRGERRPLTPMGVAPAGNNTVIETMANTARELPITGPGRHPTAQRVGLLPTAPPPASPDLGPPPPGAMGPLMDWQLGNREYAGGQAMLEGLRGGNVFPGTPNSIALNRNALSDFLSKNRMELRQRLGPEQYDAVVKAVLEGGQVGTKDILAPGQGGPLDALRQVYGRGQGGAPQILGSLLRTGAPNIGSQYTGRRPFAASPGAMTAADLVALRALGLLPGAQE